LMVKPKVNRVVEAAPKYSWANCPKKPRPKRAVPLRTTVSASAATVSILMRPKSRISVTPQSGPTLARAIGNANRPEAAGMVKKNVSQKGGRVSTRAEKADQSQHNCWRGVTWGAKIVVMGWLYKR